MENAGRGCTDRLCDLGIWGQVVIVCGKGNNAGDGFVMARHLHLREHAAGVILMSDPAELRGDAEANYRILTHTPVPMTRLDSLSPEQQSVQLRSLLSSADWIVDALLGTGATGAPRTPFSLAIECMNAAAGRKLAVDLPSGLDCDTGIAAEPTFRADHTCTLFAPKVGFSMSTAIPYLGQVHLCDIGVPRSLMENLVIGIKPE